ncbi:hypothetical protein [Conexibacter sp. DBS9H8]|uniref:hypothetical protein n=1 Tax=Conexibacter sp. DBS9H8 TaxID=2937801 RepID=UPI00200FE03D|nr:hypothetical protein [Conexibacter sp. DBS9H8]
MTRPRTTSTAFTACAILALWALTAGICLFYLTSPGLLFGRANDFVVEAYPALHQLALAHVGAFLTASPGYVGSLILRAPFALIALAFHADWQVTYLATALPCVAAAPLLATWLVRVLELPTEAFWGRVSPLGLLLVINPTFIYCIVLGHPEDVFVAALAIAGVVQAARDRWLPAMLLVGLAAVSKSWALVAVPVAICVLPQRRLRATVTVSMLIAAVDGPLILLRSGGVQSLGAGTGQIFHFSQLWAWFGPTSWVSVHAHELIVLTAAACALLWRQRHPVPRQGANAIRDALTLLSLVFLLRAAMDPWDNIYYQLPFLMAVYAIEIGRPPRLSVVSTLLLVAVTVPLPVYGFDVRATAYAIVTLPILATVIRALLARPAPESGRPRAVSSADHRQLQPGQTLVSPVAALPSPLPAQSGGREQTPR